jgi:WD40 repeat protein
VTKAQAIYSAAFSPDGKTLALGCGKDPVRTNAPWDPKTEVGISLWETATWSEIRSWPCPETGRAIRHLAWSPDGKLLASGETKGINLWDAGSGRLVKSLPSDPVDGVVFDPEGRRVLGETAAAVLVWDPASGRELVRLTGGRRRREELVVCIYLLSCDLAGREAHRLRGPRRLVPERSALTPHDRS